MTANDNILTIQLQDTYGDGWHGNTFYLIDSDGNKLSYFNPSSSNSASIGTDMTVSADDGTDWITFKIIVLNEVSLLNQNLAFRYIGNLKQSTHRHFYLNNIIFTNML